MASKVVDAVVTLTTKHLGPGSLCPPLGIGVLRCYSMKYCPYAQRTRLVLLAKKVKHEVINVNMRSKPDWLFEKDPAGKVPILEKDNKVIYESLITCDYLDDMYPDPPLYSSDPWRKAQDRLLIDKWSKVSTAWYKMGFAIGDAEVIAKAMGDICDGLDVFETELLKRGTKFFGGENPGMLDYMIWPWAERFSLSHEVAGADKILTEDRFPAIISWVECMMSDYAVVETFLPLDVHMYYLTTVSGKTVEIKRKQIEHGELSRL